MIRIESFVNRHGRRWWALHVDGKTQGVYERWEHALQDAHPDIVMRQFRLIGWVYYHVGDVGPRWGLSWECHACTDRSGESRRTPDPIRHLEWHLRGGRSATSAVQNGPNSVQSDEYEGLKTTEPTA